MDDLLGSLEGLGRAGGVLALLLCALLVAAGAGMVWIAFAGPQGMELPYPFVVQDDGQLTTTSTWFLVASAFGAIVLSMPLGFTGAQLLQRSRYPSASEVFPPMTVPQIQQALERATEIHYVCTRCRVMVPAEFSTGGCPVCASGQDYHPVESDEDARIVIAAMS